MTDPDTTGPAEQRARDIAQLIHTGDRAAARAYIESYYGPDFMRIPLDDHLNILAQLHDQMRGITVLEVREATATNATLLLRGELSGLVLAMMMAVEPDPPHRVAGIGLRPAPSPVPAAPVSAADLPGELDRWLQRLADANVFSGTVALALGGQMLFARAYGQANKDFGAPNNLDTAINLGSMNKMFTAVAIAQLVERGQLSFDDTLAKFLPGFPTPEAAQQIQLKHLLSHTAGLGSFFNDKFMSGARSRFRTVNDFLDLVRDEPPQFPPGTRWAYSNTGFQVLGAVIEAVTGRDYHAHMRAALYEPLGMGRTAAYELDHVNDNLAVGYDKVFGDDDSVWFRNNLFQAPIRGGPAGGGYSTVGDLVRFATALHQKEILSPATTELLLTPKPELNSPLYGYGFGVDLERGIVGHSGGFAGISSNLDLFRRSGHVAVVLSNYGMGSMPVAARLQELVLQGQ